MTGIMVIVFASLYFSIVIGTVKKIQMNGIRLKGKTKLIVALLPFVIFALHVKMAISNVKTNKKLAFQIIKMGTIHYPIALGLLIEVALEKFAKFAVYGNNVAYIKKKTITVESNTIHRNNWIVFNDYEKSALSLASC